MTFSVQSKAVAATLIAAALFGTSATARSLSEIDASSLSVAAARLVVGSLGLIGVVLVMRRGISLVRLWQSPVVWMMAVGIAGYQSFFFIGTDLAGVAIGTLASLALGPLFAGLLGWAINRNRPGVWWWASTAIAIGGLFVLSIDAARLTTTINPMGIAAAVAAGGCYAVYTVLGVRVVGPDVHATDVLAAAFFLGALMLLPFSWQGMGALTNSSGIAFVLWVGLAATTAAYVLFGRGLTHLTAGTVATLNLAEPLVATALGVVILKEVLARWSAVGSLLIASALALLAWATLKGKV